MLKEKNLTHIIHNRGDDLLNKILPCLLLVTILALAPTTGFCDIKSDINIIQTEIGRLQIKGTLHKVRKIFPMLKRVEPLLKRGKPEKAQRLVNDVLKILGKSSSTDVKGKILITPKVRAPIPRPWPSVKGKWVIYNSPIVSNRPQPSGLTEEHAEQAISIWNDPSIMKEGNHYVMWASLGHAAGKGTAIFKLVSKGLSGWVVDNGGKPVLEPGNKEAGDFDWFQVETPAVIKVGDTYHMYYTACKNPLPDRCGHIWTMGHATSKDGNNWVKHGELTSITSNVGKLEGNNWGWLSRAEPAVTYHKGKFYLYFADVKCRYDGCADGKYSRAIRGISLATSKDGHTFKQHTNKPVLLQTEYYGPEHKWEGYSTPWVYHNGKTFELYVDLFKKIDGKSIQTTIAHYRSKNGKKFKEVETDIVTSTNNDWATVSVRSPTVLENRKHVIMFFAGDSATDNGNTGPDIASGAVKIGIGIAKYKK